MAKRDAKPAIAPEAISQIHGVYRIFYDACIVSRIPAAGQWKYILSFLRAMRTHGVSTHQSPEIDTLNEYAKRAASELLEAIESGRLPDAVEWSIRLGHFFRYAFDLIDGPDIDRGRKVIEGSRKGHKGRYGDDAARMRRNAEMQKRIIALMEDDPKLPHSKAVIRVARAFGLKAPTVKKLMTNPRARKRKLDHGGQ